MIEIEIILIIIAVVLIAMFFRMRRAPVYASYCPHCREGMNSRATVCPHCQRDVDPAVLRKQYWVGLARRLAIIAIGIIALSLYFQPQRTQRADHGAAQQQVIQCPDTGARC